MSPVRARPLLTMSIGSTARGGYDLPGSGIATTNMLGVGLAQIMLTLVATFEFESISRYSTYLTKCTYSD